VELRPGDAAPEFELRDDSGEVLRSSQLRGARTILYFFPKADTAG